jgi:CspA family cold shock protein
MTVDVANVVRRSREDGRVSALNDAIEAAREYGHDGLVPVLEILRDWPRAGAMTRPLTQERRQMDGVIKRIVNEKGFGFIRSSDGREWFFHHSALPRDVRIDSLSEGQLVSFDEGHGPKGPRAENVELV